MNLKGTPTFARTFEIDKPIQCYRGGTRSGKSYAMMQRAVLWLITGQINGGIVPKGRFSITRSTLPALKATVLKDFNDYLFELNVYQYIEHIRTTLEYKFQGREVAFFSLDDPHKLRGREHTFLWINECTDTTYDVFLQGNVRTKNTVYLDYNPSGDPWVKTEIEDALMKRDPDQVHLDISVYTDNPFLPDRMIKQIIGLKDIDEDLYNIYTRGIWVSLKGLIYPNVTIINEIPLIGKSYFGCDFGYNDPSVFVKVVIDGQNIYIDTLVYQRELLIDDMAALIKGFIRSSDVVYCDSAEPRTIEELKRRGVNAKAAKKGRDSVRQAITFIKQHKMHLTASSVDTKKEWEVFKWDQDKEGRLTDDVVNYGKHTSDAVSYAVNRAMGNKMRLL